MVVNVRQVPHLPPGDYVLGWRWDCEESTQVRTMTIETHTKNYTQIDDDGGSGCDGITSIHGTGLVELLRHHHRRLI